MTQRLIRSISPELNLVQYNELSVLEIDHRRARAKVALQGAQLLSWRPKKNAQDVLWLSEIEPFMKAKAIRGGVPICYPWFGDTQQPAHGTARVSEWTLMEYQSTAEYMHLVFQLNDEAKIEMRLGEECELNFIHLGRVPAQLALHTYFNVGDITQTEIYGLADSCFDKLTNRQAQVPSPRIITESVDCIYKAEPFNKIYDRANRRQINIEHINATETVVWNPWHKATGGMSETGYKTMVCVETARLTELLTEGQNVGVKFSVCDL